jgi:hypothetical protein
VPQHQYRYGLSWQGTQSRAQVRVIKRTTVLTRRVSTALVPAIELAGTLSTGLSDHLRQIRKHSSSARRAFPNRTDADADAVTSDASTELLTLMLTLTLTLMR